MTTEKEKAAKGELYDANYDPQLIAERDECKMLCHEYNNTLPTEQEKRKAIIRKLFGKTKENFCIEPIFFCDYGYNIEIGENFYMNVNCVILDGAKVTFGDNVFVAPGCGFYTAGHPIGATLRNKGLEYAKPITIGNNVWIGAQVCVLPGVTIGDNCVIGAGSVVTKDIPSNVVAVGNPCHVIRNITEE
ncbi:MAG: sugar O-acetyltransferase [Bacteroidaceae bacterium]|nr:sugar O-acetyltransferase [Bacteroidaceae bacterium]